MVNVFIANLDWEITSEDLLNTFSSFGNVSYAHVVYDNATKKSKGFGYVEMEDSDQAINAINALNGLEINGRKLDVKIASPKSNRPQKKEGDKAGEKKPFNKKPGFKKPFNKGGGNFQRREGGDRPNFQRRENRDNQ